MFWYEHISDFNIVATGPSQSEGVPVVQTLKVVFWHKEHPSLSRRIRPVYLRTDQHPARRVHPAAEGPSAAQPETVSPAGQSVFITPASACFTPRR
jgi:hypothetical protein